MPTLYSNQYQDAYVDQPTNKIKRGDQSGEVKHIFWDYPISASTVPADADIIKLAKLPKGARLIEACIQFSDLGGSGTVNVGWAASAELDENGSVVVAADATGIFSAVDLDTAADTLLMSQQQANPAGLAKAFDAEVDIQMAVTDAWSATTGTLKGWLQYVVY